MKHKSQFTELQQKLQAIANTNFSNQQATARIKHLCSKMLANVDYAGLEIRIEWSPMPSFRRISITATFNDETPTNFTVTGTIYIH